MVTDNPGALERAFGAPPVVASIAGVAIADNDLGPVSIRRGRSRPDERYSPATVTLTFRRSGLADLPTIGQPVNVELTDEVLDYFSAGDPARSRFVGRVTDAKARPESKFNGPALVTIVATGDKSRLGQCQVGGVAWPEERDGARAGRIFAQLADSHPEITTGPPDPGQTMLLAKYAETAVPYDADTAFTQLSDDSGGECVELRDGSLTWRDADHRRGLVAALELNARNVEADVSFGQVLAGLVNDLEIAYGYMTAGDTSTPRPAVHVDDPDAFPSTGDGPISARQESEILGRTEALVRAVEVVGRRGRPRWRIDQGMTVELLRTLARDQAAALLAGDVGMLVRVTGFPASGPFVSAFLWAEGWTETITRNAWTFAVDFAEYSELAPSARWADMPPAETWADPALAGLSWIAFVGLPIDSGVSNRWIDQPADLKWSTVNPATAWADF
jgi:hypothetical protein